MKQNANNNSKPLKTIVIEPTNWKRTKKRNGDTWIVFVTLKHNKSPVHLGMINFQLLTMNIEWQHNTEIKASCWMAEAEKSSYVLLSREMSSFSSVSRHFLLFSFLFWAFIRYFPRTTSVQRLKFVIIYDALEIVLVLCLDIFSLRGFENDTIESNSIPSTCIMFNICCIIFLHWNFMNSRICACWSESSVSIVLNHWPKNKRECQRIYGQNNLPH